MTRPINHYAALKSYKPIPQEDAPKIGGFLDSIAGLALAAVLVSPDEPEKGHAPKQQQAPAMKRPQPMWSPA